MICPNCGVGVHPEWQHLAPEGRFAVLPFDVIRFLDRPCKGEWGIQFFRCSECSRLVACLRVTSLHDMHKNMDPQFFLIWPRHAVTKPLSPHVPERIAADLIEARNVLADSPKSSAALSRRLLQRILVAKGGTKQGDDLNAQIDAVLPTLPSYVQRSLHGVRTVGNFAAHPLKSQNAGAIFDVEPGEAEWSLDTLGDVIDFYYVRPAEEEARIAEHNKKLAEAGKPPLK